MLSVAPKFMSVFWCYWKASCWVKTGIFYSNKLSKTKGTILKWKKTTVQEKQWNHWENRISSPRNERTGNWCAEMRPENTCLSAVQLLRYWDVRRAHYLVHQANEEKEWKWYWRKFVMNKMAPNWLFASILAANFGRVARTWRQQQSWIMRIYIGNVTVKVP